jgi:hypothetical protein
MGSARLSRWHIGAIPAISDGVRSSRAVRKHCSLTRINTRHHSTRKRYRCRFPLLLLRAVHPKPACARSNSAIRLCIAAFAASIRAGKTPVSSPSIAAWYKAFHLAFFDPVKVIWYCLWGARGSIPNRSSKEGSRVRARMIKASDYFRDMYRHDWAIHQPNLVCLHFNMGSQLRSKRVRSTLFSVSFFLLFAFWLAAL